MHIGMENKIPQCPQTTDNGKYIPMIEYSTLNKKTETTTSAVNDMASEPGVKLSTNKIGQ